MASQLSTLLTTPHAPPFIYLHHPHSPSSSSIPPPPPDSPLIQVQLSAIEYSTARLLYSGILYRLAEAVGPAWTGGEVRTWDGFARGLRTLYAERRTGKGAKKASRKGKEKEVQVEQGGELGWSNWVIVITHAERLPRSLGAQWAVLTRISELTAVPITLVLASQTTWDALRPPSADAPEPLHIYLPALTRAEVLAALSSASALPLWPHFLNLFLATFFPLTHGLEELAYLARPLWEIYLAGVPPTSSAPNGVHHPNGNVSTEDDTTPPRLEITVKLLTDLKFALSLPLTLAIEHLLPRHISPRDFVHFLKPSPQPPGSLAARPKKGIPKLPGMDIPLIGRFLVVAGYLAGQNPAKSDLRLFGRGLGVDGKRKRGGGTRRAGYGRVKVGKVSWKARVEVELMSQVPQRLLGPKPFPLDRLLAIFSSLYSEHAERPPDLLPGIDEGDDYDDDGDGHDSSSDSNSDSEGESGSPSRRRRKGVNGAMVGDSLVERQRKRVERKRKRDIVREERWEEEVEGICMSVKLWSLVCCPCMRAVGVADIQIPELEAKGLFRRISPLDRLDNVMLRCEADFESAKAMARELKMTLDEYLYEAQA